MLLETTVYNGVWRLKRRRRRRRRKVLNGLGARNWYRTPATDPLSVLLDRWTNM
jgi:hypothetical protein